ncbi:MAG: type II toxin-antitoxin system prevent-host-death family antitoxin [Candidatus Moranbacteria bacterium]|nr:type II toxin-antitoxin system prevent-host-death family antitoxin [Candidatus Moranbacteria bacterium]
MKIINMHEAKTKLSKLVKEVVENDTAIILAKAGKPIAKIVPYNKKPKERKPGGMEGKIWMSDDFTGPLPPDIMKYFE